MLHNGVAIQHKSGEKRENTLSLCFAVFALGAPIAACLRHYSPANATIVPVAIEGNGSGRVHLDPDTLHSFQLGDSRLVLLNLFHLPCTFGGGKGATDFNLSLLQH